MIGGAGRTLLKAGTGAAAALFQQQQHICLREFGFAVPLCALASGFPSSARATMPMDTRSFAAQALSVADEEDQGSATSKPEIQPGDVWQRGALGEASSSKRSSKRSSRKRKKGGGEGSPAVLQQLHQQGAAGSMHGRAIRPIHNDMVQQQQQQEQDAGTAGARPALVLEDDSHPIRDRHLPRPAWTVMHTLRSEGHMVYVVGGTVRDILLGRTPKDVDILTTARQNQIKRLFRRCVVVGRRFPCAIVQVDGFTCDVSSLATQAADPSRLPLDAAALMSCYKERRPPPDRQRHGNNGYYSSSGANTSGNGWTLTWAAARRANALRRDFTANSLLYDPFSRVLHDYCGGVADCEARLLRAVQEDPADGISADPARILRGLRIAARCGLQVEAGTSTAIADLHETVLTLPPGRLSFELEQLLCYGAAGPSLLLLWRYRLMDLLMPPHAAYLKHKRLPRSSLDVASTRYDKLPLLDLARCMDELASPKTPLDPGVCVALLALPLVAARIAEARKGSPPGSPATTTGNSDGSDVDGAGVASDAEAEGEGGSAGDSSRRGTRKGGKDRVVKRRRKREVEELELAQYDLAVQTILLELTDSKLPMSRATVTKALQLLALLPRSGIGEWHKASASDWSDPPEELSTSDALLDNWLQPPPPAAATGGVGNAAFDALVDDSREGDDDATAGLAAAAGAADGPWAAANAAGNGGGVGLWSPPSFPEQQHQHQRRQQQWQLQQKLRRGLAQGTPPSARERRLFRDALCRSRCRWDSLLRLRVLKPLFVPAALKPNPKT